MYPIRTSARVYNFPTTKLDYTFNFAGELGADTITGSPVWAAVDAGPTISNESNTTTTATMMVTGGTAGGDYRIRCTATTAGGRVLVRQLTLHVRD